MACTEDGQPWPSVTAPVRLKTGSTMPTMPVVTCASDAHRDQACPLAT